MPTASPSAPPPAGNFQLMGWLAAIGAVTIWALYAVATRGLLTRATLPVWDVLAIRIVTASLLTLPVLVARAPALLALPKRTLGAIVLGSGAPFSLGNAGGLAWAPAAHSGALVAPLGAVFTGLLAWLALSEPIGRRTGIGLGLITLGALFVVVATLTGPFDLGVLIGHAHFTAAAAIWSLYTVVIRRSPKAGVFGAVAIASWGSVPLYLVPYVLVRGPRFLEAPWSEILAHAVVQGLFGAVLSILLFNLAVGRLGASRTAAVGAIVPAETALLGWLALGETPTPLELAGLVVLTSGVWLTTGARLAPATADPVPPVPDQAGPARAGADAAAATLRPSAAPLPKPVPQPGSTP